MSICATGAPAAPAARRFGRSRRASARAFFVRSASIERGSTRMSRAAHRILKADPVMAALIGAVGPCRLKLHPERGPFEALARAIAHQQLHGIAAERILAR